MKGEAEARGGEGEKGYKGGMKQRRAPQLHNQCRKKGEKDCGSREPLRERAAQNTATVKFHPNKGTQPRKGIGERNQRRAPQQGD